MKQCTKCNKTKFESEFYKHRKGLYPSCKECKKAIANINRIKKPRALKSGTHIDIQQCTKCKEQKSINEFFFRKERAYYDTVCKVCKRIRSISRKYNVSLDEAKRLYNTSKCEICNKQISNQKQHVDHCHNSGKVRGVLCNHCNAGIGFFFNNKDLLMKTIKYLDRNE